MGLFTPVPALAGDCDGTPAVDTITCSADPTTPDDIIGLGLGDDTYVQDAGVTSQYVDGDGLEDGTESSGDGGDDHLTINGTVTACVSGDNVDGDGGDDTIIINGEVQCSVDGDAATGNGGNDTIILNGDVGSTISGDYVDLDGGNDTIIVNGYVGDEVYGDDSGGDGGDDTITVTSNGFVAEDLYGDFNGGNGGNDTITIDGHVDDDVYGDDSDGNGGSDRITINGTVGDNVVGDDVSLNGANDLIVINGFVGGDVYGDGADGNGGNDTIIINGTVSGDVYGDGVLGAGGDDMVTLGLGASVGGIIDGEDGFDILQIYVRKHDQLTGYDPAGGTISIDGHTYTWLNFEKLIGLLLESGRLLFENSFAFAITQTDGIAVFNEHGRIAFISYAIVDDLAVGENLTFSTPNAAGWFVIVTNLGVNPNNASSSLYQVEIFDPTLTMVGSFTFSN